jgi:hypothetical protein
MIAKTNIVLIFWSQPSGRPRFFIPSVPAMLSQYDGLFGGIYHISTQYEEYSNDSISRAEPKHGFYGPSW